MFGLSKNELKVEAKPKGFLLLTIELNDVLLFLFTLGYVTTNS